MKAVRSVFALTDFAVASYQPNATIKPRQTREIKNWESASIINVVLWNSAYRNNMKVPISPGRLNEKRK
jgi:hypothetical protein